MCCDLLKWLARQGVELKLFGPRADKSCMRYFEGVQGSIHRLYLWTAALCTPIVVLIPIAFNPLVVYFNPQVAYYPEKFKLLMALSVPVFVAVLGILLLERRVVRIPLLVPALAFLSVSVVSALLSKDLLHTLVGDRHDGLATLGVGILLFYAAGSSLSSWARVRVLLMSMVVTAIIVSLYGIMQHFGLDPVPGWGIPWYAGTERAFSTIGNPLHLAAYLTLSMGATVALYFRTDSRLERALWLLALALIGSCWLYTYARGAVLGVGLAFPIMLWLSYRKMRTVRPLLLPTAVLVISIVAASQLGGTGASERVTATSGDSAMSAVLRLYIWRDTIPVLLERPLLGHGPDNFAMPFERHEGEDLKAALFNPSMGESDTVDKAHNELLQVAATTGLLGLAAYLWVLTSYFRSAYQSGGWPIIALSGGAMAYVLQLQTAFTTISTGVTFWTVLGISVAIMRLQEREGPCSSYGQADAGDQRPFVEIERP